HRPPADRRGPARPRAARRAHRPRRPRRRPGRPQHLAQRRRRADRRRRRGRPRLLVAPPRRRPDPRGPRDREARMTLARPPRPGLARRLGARLRTLAGLVAHFLHPARFVLAPLLIVLLLAGALLW